jgi:hypothetical protein
VCGIATADLRRLGVQPGDLPAAVRRYRTRYPGAAATPKAIAKHRAEIVAPVAAENGWKELKPKPGETPAEWVERVRGQGLSRAKVETTLKAEWGLGGG